MNAALAAIRAAGGDFGHLDGATMISVTISERNLRDLMAQWEKQRGAVISRITEDAYLLTVRVEPDEIHYAGREGENPFPPKDSNEP